MRILKKPLILVAFLIVAALPLLMNSENTPDYTNTIEVQQEMSEEVLPDQKPKASIGPVFAPLTISPGWISANWVTYAGNYPDCFLTDGSKRTLRNCEFAGSSSSAYGLRLVDFTSGLNFTVLNVKVYVTGSSIPVNSSGIAIQNSPARITIQDCQIYNFEVGITANSSSSITFEHNEINNNKHNGLIVNYTNSALIRNNIIHDNGGSGIVITQSTSSSVYTNNVYDNVGSGVLIAGNTTTGNHRVTSNQLIRNQYGFSASSVISNLNITDNNCSYNAFDGINIQGCAKALVTGNNAHYNTYNGISFISNVIRTEIPQGALYAMFDGNFARFNSRVGMVFSHNFKPQIINNVMEYNQLGGLRVGSGDNGYVFNNDMTYNHGSAVLIESEYNILIDSNDVLHNYDDGIVVRTSESVNLYLNIITNNSKNGIIFEGNTSESNYDEVKDNGENGLLCSGGANNIYSLTATGNRNGIYISGDNNYVGFTSNLNSNDEYGLVVTGKLNTIQTNNIRYNLIGGINLAGNNNTISGITLTNNRFYGILLNGTGNNLVSNLMTGTGIVFVPSSIAEMKSNAIPTSNKMNTLDVIALYSISSYSVPGTPGQVIAIDCTALTISGKTINYAGLAVALYYCNNVDILSATIRYNSVGGVFGYETTDVTVDSSTIYESTNGLFGSISNLNINLCTFDQNNDTGIEVEGTGFQCIDTDVLSSDMNGIVFTGETGLMDNCQVDDSGQYGIMINANDTDVYNCDLFSTRSDIGIYFQSSSVGSINLTTIISSSGISITIETSNNIVVESNSISTLFDAGLFLMSSQYCTVKANTFSYYGIEMGGNVNEDFSTHTIPFTNYRDGKLIRYYKGINSSVINLASQSVAQVILVNSNGASIKNFIITDDVVGLQVFYGYNNLFTGFINNSLKENVMVFRSTSNTFDAMTIVNGTFGPYFAGIINFEAAGNKYQKSVFRGTYEGLWIYKSNSVTVDQCTFERNDNAIWMVNSSFCYIQRNTFRNVYNLNFDLYGGALNYFQNNLIDTPFQYGIRLEATNNNYILGDTFLSGKYIAIEFINSPSNIIQDTNISGYENTAAISIDSNSNNNRFDRVYITFTAIINANNLGFNIQGASNCEIASTEIKYAYYGIYLYATDSISIINSLIDNGTFGVWAIFTTQLSITQSIFSKNLDSGIYLLLSDDILIERNTIKANYRGISMISSTNIIINLNAFCGNTGGDLYEDAAEFTYTLSSPCSEATESGSTMSRSAKQNEINFNIVLMFMVKYIFPIPVAIIAFFGGKRIYLKSKDLA